MQKSVIGLTAFAFVAASFIGSAAAMTFISTNWQDTDLSLSDCLDRAENAIRDAGFKTLSHTDYARHGLKGEYTAQVRCASDKGFVFFVIAGPTDQTGKYLKAVKDAF
jgi:hypothetical protein